MSRLDPYRKKRSAERTPEPFGGALPTGGNLFVVQKHAATRLHWDLRLEHEGTLVSWAVPKGFSADPADKRLAMKVEDHPLEYADFEGVIPAGQYGAGPVIVWDRGTWAPVGDAAEGLAKGTLKFDLKGYKLRGRWTLVKTKQAENSWLLIKEGDAFASDAGPDAYPDDSIGSGLTVEERADPEPAIERVRSLLADAGAKEADVDPAAVKVMLAVAEEEPFTKEGWVFEFKLDGYRILGWRDGPDAGLVSRNGNDLTRTFPEIARAVASLPYDGLILDGEVVVHDARGLPSFDLLQRRGRLERWSDVLRAAVELPATYYAFDLVACEGYDARRLPLVERKRILREVLPTVGPIRYSDHVETMGEAVYERAVEMDLEGVVAKKAEGPYRGTRSKDWIKVRSVRTDDYAVVGWKAPKGTRAGFGSLHLARYDGEGLVYVGSVGTGFDGAALDSISEALASREVDEAPCRPPEGGELPKGKENRWTKPGMVVEVRYKEVTGQGLLRHPAFLRVRDDKEPHECAGGFAHPQIDEPVEVAAPEEPPERTIAFTNLDKVLWPDDGYTKGDLIDYYRAVADWMLPYLRDRPLVLTRFPDGIDGTSFFQKDAPDWAPDWLRTATIWSEGSDRELSYFVVDEVDQLLWIANSAALLLHVWASRVTALGNPDWCILDLDPKDAPFGDVVAVAKAIRTVCDEIDLPVFVKTSGGSGLHTMIPLGRQTTHEQSRLLGELMARVIVRENPEIATIQRVVSKRKGRVYVDFLQNGHGKLLVAPFSSRPRPGATVSTPLRWKEVVPSLDVSRFTIESVPRRVRSMKDDPLRPVLELAPDLVGALERLGERMG